MPTWTDQSGSVLTSSNCAHRFAGVGVEADPPRTEWFVTLADDAASIRLDGEVPITTALRRLAPMDGGIVVAATTGVRFHHHPTIVVRRLGAGRIGRRTDRLQNQLGMQRDMRADDFTQARNVDFGNFVDRCRDLVGKVSHLVTEHADLHAADSTGSHGCGQADEFGEGAGTRE